MPNIEAYKIIYLQKNLTFMKKWVPLTTIKIVRGALKKGGRLKSPHRAKYNL